MTERPQDLLAELGAELAWDRPDEARREAMRAALLRAASDEPRVAPVRARRWVLGGALAGALAMAAAVAIVVTRAGTPPVDGTSRALASVESVGSAAASYARHVERTEGGLDEVIDVRDGDVKLKSAALAAGDHLRVRGGDVEVDVVGGAVAELEVVVVGEAMDHVTVRGGSAQVMVGGQRAVFLASGQTWHAATITAMTELPHGSAAAVDAPVIVAPVTPVAPVAPGPGPVIAPVVPEPAVAAPRASRPERPEGVERPRVVAAPRAPAIEVTSPATSPLPSPSRSTTTTTSTTTSTIPEEGRGAPAIPVANPGPSAVEQHFTRGTALLRAGRAADAAVELGLAAASSDPLAVDARYFQAVALVRANQPAEAERAAVAFLDRAPTSPHRGRATVLLARLLATHDQASARAWFQSALHDADPAVVSAATAGLALLDSLSAALRLRCRVPFSPDLYVNALRFAAVRHAGQKVPDSELPYLVHLTSVAAEVIAALAAGAPIARPDLAVQCALLHDCVEDTATTRDEVAAAFGAEVAEGVVALSKDAALPKAERMADSLRRLRAQPAEVQMVKLADRITNLAPPPSSWTPDKCARYRDEATQIADALGASCAILDARLRARIVAYAAHTG